ncbi:MAG: pseudouridine synthase [Pseudobdellovibrio sp.]
MSDSSPKIAFENDDFIVCDKPPFVLSTPDRFKSDRPCLGLQLQELKKIQIYPVHRLDYEVSGLILYAKNSKAHKASQDWFQSKEVQKKYRAISLKQSFSHWPAQVENSREQISLTPNSRFLWKMKIARGKKRSYESPHGDNSETQAIFVKEDHLGLLHWELYPITGRSHQLRLELSRHGFPILGDHLYGGSQEIQSGVWPYGGIALRSVSIQLPEEAYVKYKLPRIISVEYLHV